MHFLHNLEWLANLGYRHIGPIHLIIQHIFITNINNIVHKLIEWKGKDESPTNQGAPIEEPNEKSCTVEESLQN
jgi:hypothetical protein